MEQAVPPAATTHNYAIDDAPLRFRDVIRGLSRDAPCHGMLTRQQPCFLRTGACRSSRVLLRRAAAAPRCRAAAASASMTSVTQLDPTCPAEPLPGVSREVRQV